jgi:Biotin and Thiamin Synthesis associated domain
VSGLELARVIATARITMPRSVVRLSAGRLNFSFADQARATGPRHAAPVAWSPSCCVSVWQQVPGCCTMQQASLRATKLAYLTAGAGVVHTNQHIML